jgi:dihydroorotase
VLRKLTIAPARILGLGVGRLTPGAPADLVIFDPAAKGRIHTDEFRSKSKNAPFDGRPIQGRVERTVVDGRIIFERAA